MEEMTKAEEIRSLIYKLALRAETGAEWAEICRLEALAIELEKAENNA